MAERQKTRIVSDEETEKQREYIYSIRDILKSENKTHFAFVETYGCQQNSSDSEKIKGMLFDMGYDFCDDPKDADFILYNTCAVRENAELRVFGNLGALKLIKRKKENVIIAVCGCMMQQEHIKERIKSKYKHVDLIFGTHALYRFPKLLFNVMNGSREIDVQDEPGAVFEGISYKRDPIPLAKIPIMYGCNNFCTYCIVPYVRGRERSRDAKNILAEVRDVAKAGYREVMLLGQNVNSYGKDLGIGVDFADLIRMINDIPGDFIIRFMTSHPKDATEKLFRTMAECKKCAHQLHLPVQSGNDRILKVMNRHYDREKYVSQVKLARSYMPDLVLTTDIIVGFPGETDEEFEDTISLCEEVRYDAMFTFIYSKRVGTPAAVMEDPYTREDKQKHFDRLTEVSNRISGEKHREYIGTEQLVLIDGVTGKEEYNLSARTNGGRLVHLKGSPDLIGQFITVKITEGNTWALYGELE